MSVLLMLVGILGFLQAKRDKEYIRKIPRMQEIQKLPLLLLENVLSVICGICILWAYFVSDDVFLLCIGLIGTVVSVFLLGISAALHYKEK